MLIPLICDFLYIHYYQPLNFLTNELLQSCNTFNSYNSNMANINTQNCQIMTTIKNGISKFKPMIKIAIVANHTFFTVITFSRINNFS